MARRYNVTGRFAQPDPYGGSYDFSDPQSLNRYAYVGNDPVNRRDPSGLLNAWVVSGPCPAGSCVVNVFADPFAAIDTSIGGPPDQNRPIMRLTEPLLRGGGGHVGGIHEGAHSAPQEPSKVNDCKTLADYVEQIANDTLGGGNVQTFMNKLATTFTEFTAATLSAIRAINEGQPGNNDHLQFGSEGFARPFYEPPTDNGVPSNQVRHAVGGLIAGYVGIPLHVPGAGANSRIRGMNDREDPTDIRHGVPDINLNNQTVPYGNRIGGYVPMMIGSPPPSEGLEAARGLAGWIRQTLCAH